MASQQHASMPVPMEEEDTDDASGMDIAVKKPWMSQRKMLTLIFGMAVAGTALVASLSLSVNSSKTVYGEMDQVAAISQFNSDDPCADKPQIKIVKPASGNSNLANVSDQTKPEGIIFPGKYIDPKKNTEKTVKVVVNALPPSDKAHTTPHNGLWGKYAGIAVKGGNLMHLKFSIKDENDNPVILRELDITFFDIDQHAAKGDVEYVKLWSPTAYYVTNGNVINITKNAAEGSVTFAAMKDGTGADNPQDPLALSAEQKHKAVTVKYENADFFEAEVGSTGHLGGTVPRGFQFVFRPSLLCAKTTDGNVAVDETDLVTTTVTTTVPATTTAETKNCLFTVPVINWCFPKLW